MANDALAKETTTTEEIIPLWPSVAPGSDGFNREEKTDLRNPGPRQDRWITNVSKPTLTIFRPDPAKATGAAVVICPGGGYGGLSFDKEGTYPAKWLAERGVLGVVLKSRVGGGANEHPAPMDDVQRAMQTVRANAKAWGVEPNKIGVMGFSAGGHLAATASNLWIEAAPDASESLRQVTSRPDFSILVYPVITLDKTVTHGGSRTNLLGKEPSEELVELLSLEKQVTKQTPPALLIQATDDGAVVPENAIRYYQALVKNKIDAELHIYQSGGHGFGMWRDENTIATWPAAMEAWLKARGYVK